MASGGAAAVIIGNEVLSAKVEEQNGALLVRRLREHGISLKVMVVVPDEVDAIVEAVQMARARARYVFTSGGIGPTHDDLTVRAVALALGKGVVRSPQLEALVREHYLTAIPSEAMRLAEVPEGAELIYQEGLWFPVMACDGVFLLPGVPQLFRLQLETVLSRLQGVPMVLRCIYLQANEADVAQVLDRVALAMPEVAIGSYPTFDRAAGYKVKVTVEHPLADQVDAAVDRLKRDLPAETLVRVE